MYVKLQSKKFLTFSSDHSPIVQWKLSKSMTYIHIRKKNKLISVYNSIIYSPIYSEFIY